MWKAQRLSAFHMDAVMLGGASCAAAQGEAALDEPLQRKAIFQRAHRNKGAVVSGSRAVKSDMQLVYVPLEGRAFRHQVSCLFIVYLA